MLRALHGEVTEQYSVGLPAKLAGYEGTGCYGPLARIHSCLQDHRGHEVFAKALVLPAVDYYLPRRRQIVEIDEPQHFTAPRLLALRHYPTDIEVGYDRQRWMVLCEDLDRHDADPVYRDEQRAWYDTLRDFAPQVLGGEPTIRLYVADGVWCAMDPSQEDDIERFRSILEGRER